MEKNNHLWYPVIKTTAKRLRKNLETKISAEMVRKQLTRFLDYSMYPFSRQNKHCNLFLFKNNY